MRIKVQVVQAWAKSRENTLLKRSELRGKAVFLTPRLSEFEILNVTNLIFHNLLDFRLFYEYLSSFEFN